VDELQQLAQKPKIFCATIVCTNTEKHGEFEFLQDIKYADCNVDKIPKGLITRTGNPTNPQHKMLISPCGRLIFGYPC
jgi:hypothetical protein